MFADHFKQYFTKNIGYVGRKLYAAGILPWHLTVLSIAAKIAALVSVLQQNLALFAVFVYLDYVADGLDGFVARSAGKTSKKWAFLEHTCDFFFRSLWIWALAFITAIPWWLALFFVWAMSVSVIVLLLGLIEKVQTVSWLPAAGDWVLLIAVLTGNFPLWLLIGGAWALGMAGIRVIAVVTLTK